MTWAALLSVLFLAALVAAYVIGLTHGYGRAFPLAVREAARFITNHEKGNDHDDD